MLTPIFRTTGDGNCLYNACSIALCGTEILAPHLCCLTSIELFVNSVFYVKHPILEQQHNKGAFSCIANAFAMCLSDIALDSFAKEDPSKSVVAEAYNNALNRQWSSFLCILALSSAVKRPVEAYYPVSADEEKKDSLSTMFNCTIYPRVTAGLKPSDERIHLFRCALMPIDYSVVNKVPENRNHYVALCKPKDNTNDPKSIRHFFVMPVVPGFDSLKLSQANPPIPSSVSQPSCVSQPKQLSISQTSKSSSGTQKVKKKQIYLDKLFTKKRKFTEQGDEEEAAQPKKRLTNLVKVESSLKPVASFPMDIANYVNVSLTDEQKYHALCNIWVPSSTYAFPLDKDKRKFRFEWFKLFPWLAYSQKEDGAFCINCVLFGSQCKGEHNTSKLQRLFTSPLKAWKVASSKLREHVEKSPLHKAATSCAAVLRSHMERKSEPVDVMLDEMKKQQIEENRKILKPIVGAIVLCGRQNIPLRGHRDDSSNYLSSEVNCGNFIEILKYGAQCAGKTLEEFFGSTPKNITYKSETTQNEIIDICGDLLTKRITNEVRKAKFFSILADEAADCGNVEQLSLVIRFCG